jgi:hypothetical protein
VAAQDATFAFTEVPTGKCSLRALRLRPRPADGTVGNASRNGLGPSITETVAPRSGLRLMVDDRSGSGRGGDDAESCRRSPSATKGEVSVVGRLPAAVVERVVKQSLGRFKLCYAQALRTNPDLEGRVVATFEISRSGDVTKVSAKDPGTTLADPDVVSCIVRGFSNLTFPQPEEGVVTVKYEIVFAAELEAP